ncbi:MAG: AbrB/MazE/SpoVT family DNA-binding domain-containing protein [Halobacteriales archaeon]|nr:AbrB/MazE/SpoVT family DNA-binding domain-containing protein [Halobacteriales archaeon]
MSVEGTDGKDKEAEGTEGVGSVSGNQASIPAEVRRAADIEDGDRIRWCWKDGEVHVEVLRQREGVLPDGFDGFEPEKASLHHDEVGLVLSGERDAGEE